MEIRLHPQNNCNICCSCAYNLMSKLLYVDVNALDSTGWMRNEITIKTVFVFTTIGPTGLRRCLVKALLVSWR
jgi:hypothetical protein